MPEPDYTALNKATEIENRRRLDLMTAIANYGQLTALKARGKAEHDDVERRFALCRGSINSLIEGAHDVGEELGKVT